MSAGFSRFARLASFVLSGIVCIAAPSVGTADPGVSTHADAAGLTSDPSAIQSTAGVWTLSLDRTHANCRVLLRSQKADGGDYFLGMPAACRHAMPGLETIGRWTMPDAKHVSLDDPAGKSILRLAATADGGFAGASEDGGYAMVPGIGTGRSAAGFDPVDTEPAGGFDTVPPPPVRKRKKVDAAVEAPREKRADLAGRYAVMREKRDTGCMVTLDDSARAKGGERAQLAPGCRDQGIVIFDPTAWQIVKGKLVLTARAGHTAVLDNKNEGLWEKDVKDGGKPLGLKKL